MSSIEHSLEMVYVPSDSMNNLLESAVRHYSSFFKLPPINKMVIVLALICMAGGAFSVMITSSVHSSLILGLPLGFVLLSVTLLSDYVISKAVLRHDAVYDIRRTTGLSVFSWGIWVFFIALGVVLSNFIESYWGIRACLLGYLAVTILRLTVLLSTSFGKIARIFAAALITPTLCYFIFLTIWARSDFQVFSLISFLGPAILISAGSSVLLIHLVDRVGLRILGVSGISIFKAFLLNWITGLNEPFEEILEMLGERRDVEVGIIKFESKKPKAIIVVPSVHPGPFKNVGSSILPFLIKKSLENKLRCVTCVLHGLFGHEFDLTSQNQNTRIISNIIENLDFEHSVEEASPFVSISDGDAVACSQIFGNSAIVSFTLAPRTTEDLPEELGLLVRQTAEKLGLNCCIIANAHNSINGSINMDDALVSLKKVAVSCLEKAVSLERLPLEVGAATATLNEFSLKDGLGEGGVSVVVVKVGEQKTAYVVIDGNNMVSGLREEILTALESLGINAGEVFTTDTHSVNAIVLGERGYHPIGEVINHEKLIAYIKEVASCALNNLEPVAAACNVIIVPKVKVIGEAMLKKLCLLIEEALGKAKRWAVQIFSASALSTLLILAFYP